MTETERNAAAVLIRALPWKQIIATVMAALIIQVLAGLAAGAFFAFEIRRDVQEHGAAIQKQQASIIHHDAQLADHAERITLNEAAVSDQRTHAASLLNDIQARLGRIEAALLSQGRRTEAQPTANLPGRPPG